jgi:serine/threonine protein phosphatase PrpC
VFCYYCGNYRVARLGIVPKQLRHTPRNRPQAPDDTVRPFSAHIDVSGLSHPGKVRPRNEDHFIVTRIGRYLETTLTSLPPGEVPERAEEVGYAMIVADGMGGHAGGELASRMAISGLVKLVLEMPDWIFHLDDTVSEAATERSKRRFRHLNALLIEQGAQDPALRGMGTTMTAARNLGRNLQIVHVGDSRAYLLRQSSLHRLTRDHTYVQLLVDSGQLSKEEAADFGARHVLVNALGGFDDDVEVDVDQLELRSGDRLLLCSDGLTDLVDDDAIRQVLIESRESAEASRRLVDVALARGGRDNVTVVVAAYTFS